MATDLTNISATIRAVVSITAEKTTDMGVTVSAPLSESEVHAPAFGSGDNQVNQVWWDTRILAGAATEELDLAGSLTNAFGVVVTLATVKFIYIHNTSDEVTTAHVAATDADMLIGAAAATQFIGPFRTAGAATDTLSLHAGDWLCISKLKTGWACTGASLDKLKIANNDATDELQYDIVIVGVSA